MYAYIMSQTALILVDVQYDFLPPNGALAVPNGREIIPLIKDLLGVEGNDALDWNTVIATQVGLVK
jgi:nicotinamidase-related amidase